MSGNANSSTARRLAVLMWISGFAIGTPFGMAVRIIESAHAAEAPKPPETIILPASLVVALENYINTRVPTGEGRAYMDALDGCVRVQIPNREGKIISQGECPEVSAEMARQAAALNTARAEGAKKTDTERAGAALSPSDR